MKICLVTSLYPPLVQGGAEIYVERIARALAANHQVVVVTTEPGFHWGPAVEHTPEGITVDRLAPANVAHLTHLPHHLLAQGAFRAVDFWHPQVWAAMRRILRREQPDVVHIHNSTGLSLAAILSAVGGHRPRIPVAMTLHDYGLVCAYASLWHPDGHTCRPDRPCRLFASVNRPLVRAVGLALSPSAYVMREHERRGFFGHAMRRVLPHGLEVAAEPGLAGAGAGGAAWDKGTFDVLFIGRVQAHKGIEVLVRAFLGLPDPSLRLHVAGIGPSLAGAKALASTDSRIQFYGFVSGAARDALLQQADCLVLPSLWPDNYPVSIQEAMQAGVVVIASRVGGIPEMVEDGISGVLIDPGDEGGIAAAVERLRRSPELLARLRSGGLAASRRWDMGRHVRALVDAYEELLAVTGRRRIDSSGGTVDSARRVA